MGLKQQAVNSVKWTTISTGIGSFMQLIQVVVLTRFLDKEDFGLMAMALFVIGISKIFIDMGVSNALIYKQQVNKYQLSSLFWLNILLGIAIFLIVIFLSPFIADFYETPDLIGVIDWVAVSFLIIPWGQQFEALLRKNLRFKILAIQDITGKTAGLIVAIVLAVMGYGVYALVFANLVTSIVFVLVQSIVGYKDYRPQFLFSLRSLKGKGFFSFGLFQMGGNVVNYFGANFDTILIGKLLGMEALGLYNIAKILASKPFQVINPVITKVAFPVFSKIQDDTPKLKVAYLKCVHLLTSANAPVYIVMILFAYPIIHIFFGPEWQAAAPILQLLCISFLCSSIGNPMGSLQLAKGRADMGFYWNLVLLLVVPLTIWLGSFHGLIGVALYLALLKVFILLFPVWFFFIRPLSNARFLEYFTSFAHPSTVALGAGVLPLFAILYISNNYLQLIVGGCAYALLYLILCYFLNKPLILEIKGVLPKKIQAFLRLT